MKTILLLTTLLFLGACESNTNGNAWFKESCEINQKFAEDRWDRQSFVAGLCWFASQNCKIECEANSEKCDLLYTKSVDVCNYLGTFEESKEKEVKSY